MLYFTCHQWYFLRKYTSLTPKGTFYVLRHSTSLTNGIVLHKEGRFTSPTTYGTSSGEKLTSPNTRGACTCLATSSDTRNRKRNQIVIQASHGNNSTACKWVAIYNFSGRPATLINSLYSLCRQSESVWLMTDDPRGQGSLYFHTG